MTSSVAPRAVGYDRLTLLAVRAVFLVNGIAAASWAPLVPSAKLGLGLSEADLGLTLLFGGIGTLIGMPAVTVSMVRLGCKATTLIGSVLLALVLPAMIAAPNQAALAAALLVFGLSLAVQGMAANTFASDLERAMGRPLMSSFHAFYSLGGLIGALAVGAMLRLGLPPIGCVLVVSGTLVVCSASLIPRLPRESGASRPAAGRVFALPRGAAWLLGFFCFVSFLGEGSVTDWSAVFLRFSRGFAEADGGWGYAGFAVAMTMSRMTGDLVIRRFGRAPVLGGGGALAALGLTLGAAIPVGWVGVLGFALVGLGAGNIVPILFSAAARLPNLSPMIAIPAVSTFGCVGFLVGPAMIGVIAEHTGVPGALFCVALLFSTVAMGARRVAAGADRR